MLTDLITQIRLPFLRDRGLYRSLQHILGFYPRDIRPYKVALLHRSASKKVQIEGKRLNNERLEFLGDAILGAVVGHIVYRHFPKKPEGFLTNTRSNIVKRQSLNKLAKDMGLDRLIVSDLKSQAHNSYVNGNAFEALVGAIYLDRGYGHCVTFVKKKIMDQLVNIEKAASEVNYKSKLIEWGQRNRIEIDFQSEEGKEDNASPVFNTRIMIGGTLCGTGRGYSKKESQQAAAKQALGRLNSDREFKLALTAPKELQMERYDEIAPVSVVEKQAATENTEENVDIDFSDISMRAKTREEIIAEAERQAYTE
ncbi:MAG: ribonuclease III [Bacteroidaceae bacterium]|nr:ribonuclease III [Bacteroidaceae bacterium]